MGSGPSSHERDESKNRTGLDDVPESCVASILAHLDPVEICKFGGLSRAFHAASSADFVWESKLPSNYKEILRKVFDEVGSHDLCKKKIYARLCRPITFDGGTKEVWMDKSNGGIFFSISSKAMKITGIDDRRYWNQIPTDESRFHTVAYLRQVWWLEAKVDLEFEFPRGTYSVFFRLHLGKPSKIRSRRVCNLDKVHGWDLKPVRFQMSTSNGQKSSSQHYMNQPCNWVMYHVGDFVVENPNETTKLDFSMTQIDCTHTKGGLCLDSVLIYPSECKER